MGLDDWDGVGDGTGTDVGRAVSLDIAVSGGIPAMNLGDMVINGIVIENLVMQMMIFCHQLIMQLVVQ